MTRIAHSELQTYKRCKRQWWLKYYRRLEPIEDRVTGPMVIGNVVHEALASYYEKHDDPIAFVQGAYEDLQREYPDAAELLIKDAETAEAMVQGYIEWLEETGADQDYEVISTETAAEFPLVEDINLLGKIDSRVRRLSDGARLFLDHKTVGNFADIENTAHLNEQMLQYHLLEYLEALSKNKLLSEKERTDGGIFNMLRRVKRTLNARPPFYKRMEVRHNVEELRSYWTRVVATSLDIKETRSLLDNGSDHRIAAYPTPTKSCSFDCPFFSVCHMFDDGSDVEAVLPDMYKEHDPYERYKV